MASSSRSSPPPATFAAALAAQVAGKHSEAAKMYGEIINATSDATSTMALCNRAASYLQLELFRQCIKDCDAALALDANCLQAYVRKGTALHRMGKEDAAKDVWLEGSKATGDIDLHRALLQACEHGLADAAPAGLPATPPPAAERSRQEAESASPSQAGPSGARILPAEGGLAAELGPDLLEQVSDRLKKNAEASGRMEELVAPGVLLVNTGRYEQACSYFTDLIARHRGKALVPALLGRGSAFALLSRLDLAIRDFGDAIRRDATCADAYKRRGQCLAAKGEEDAAVEDLSRALELQPDEDCYFQRGAIYHKQQNFRRGAADLRRSVEMGGQGRLAGWNMLGLCLTQLGECNQAIDAFRRASELEPGAREPWNNMGQAYKELALPDESLRAFEASLERDPAYGHALHMRAALHHGVGDPRAAIADMRRAVAAEPTRVEFRHFLAVLLQQLGQLREAVAEYERALELQPGHQAAYAGREAAIFWQQRLDDDWRSFNVDADLDPRVKEVACKRRPVARMQGYKRRELPAGARGVELSDAPSSPEVAALLAAADRLGAYVQNRTPGFLPNRRQHRALGLAILEMAQELRARWAEGRARPLAEGEAHPKAHRFGPGGSKRHERAGLPWGWRDFFDVAVRWRQYSEPNDPVWWVDLLTPEEFAAGFGSHTPMYSGQMRVPRYYPNYRPALAIMKELMPEQCALTPAQKAAVEAARECGELHAIMKNQDFYVITPCHSTRRPGRTMEGTRLTVQARPPEGYEFSIRTPGTPARQAEFDAELAHAWRELWAAATAPEAAFSLDRFSAAALAVAFYWYNCMPLSRGSAAVGHISIVAAHLAMGYEVASPIPEGHQIDWEAILRYRPQDFLKEESAWMYPARRPSAALDGLPLVSRAIPTLRAAIAALNALPCPWPDAGPAGSPPPLPAA